MKTIEIIKTGLHFQSWGEIYCGCKANWITPEDVLVLLRDNKVDHADEKDFVSLYLALDESYYQFLEQLKSLLYREEGIVISKNEDELSDIVFDYIPSKFFKIWELEFLMEIINSPLLVSEKLNQVALLFDEMNYPEEWKPFLFYQQQKDGCYLDEKTLYQNLNNYVESQKRLFA
jgi:hypothetical protein